MSALPTADPYLPGHGDPSWSASHYDLDLAYVLDGNRLSGTAVIRGTARQETSRVVLDLAYLQVQKVAVDGKPPAKWAHRDHRLVLTLRRPLQEGQGFTVQVRYSGRPKPLVVRPHGDAGWEELTDGVIVAGQPHGAPTWFPCNDRPDDKASYVLSVAVPTGYTVVANGTLTARERRGSGETWVYEQHEPMATYLATVQVGRYDLVRLEAGPAGVPITLAVPPGADWEPAFGRQADMMAAYVDLFGPYPFPAYTAVVTDDDLDIPLESQSLSTFGRNHLDPDWRTNRLVAHELAHQWFGNTVTLRAWKDIWLHEGFACYAEWLWSESAGLGTADEHARHHHERLRELEEDVVVADPGPDLMFDDRVYKRGALTLHALRLRVGDPVFFPLLREWVARHRAGSVSTAEFEELAAEMSGTDLGELFDAWLRRKELPEAPGRA